MDKGEFVRGGYRVEPALNGGWVVIRGCFMNDGYPRDIAAFSDTDDLLSFLKDDHKALARSERGVEAPETKYTAA